MRQRATRKWPIRQFDSAHVRKSSAIPVCLSESCLSHDVTRTLRYCPYQFKRNVPFCIVHVKYVFCRSFDVHKIKKNIKVRKIFLALLYLISIQEMEQLSFRFAYSTTLYYFFFCKLLYSYCDDRFCRSQL